MIASAFFFSAMQIFIATTADTIPIFEQVFFRNFFASGIAIFFISKEKVRFSGEGKNIKFLLFRACAGYLGMTTLFYASGNAAQGDVSTLAKMSPFVTILLAGLFLGEKVKKIHIVALLIAFTGAIFVSGPKFNSEIVPLISAFAASVFGGIAYTFVSFLKGKEHPWLIIFVFSFISTIFSTPIMLMDFVLPNLQEFIYLTMIGVFAAGGQICLTYSYALAPASEVSVFNYSGIVFSMIFGYVFLNQNLQYTSYIGGALVILAGVLMFLNAKKDVFCFTE